MERDRTRALPEPTLPGDLGCPRFFFLNRSDMEPRDGDATAIIQPHHYSTPLRVDRRVLAARHVVATPSTGQDEKCLKRPHRQELPNIRDHFGNLSMSVKRRKHAANIPRDFGSRG